MKKFFSEFKAFIAKGNVVDMAVAVIIGGAFGKIVTALVDDIIMPLISLLTGRVDVSDWKWVIRAADEAAGQAETALLYGDFIQRIIDFLIVAFCIFVVLKLILDFQARTEKLLKHKQEEEAVEEAPAETEMDVLKDIRTLLQEQNKQ